MWGRRQAHGRCGPYPAHHPGAGPTHRAPQRRSRGGRAVLVGSYCRSRAPRSQPDEHASPRGTRSAHRHPRPGSACRRRAVRREWRPWRGEGRRRAWREGYRADVGVSAICGGTGREGRSIARERCRGEGGSWPAASPALIRALSLVRPSAFHDQPARGPVAALRLFGLHPKSDRGRRPDTSGASRAG